MNRQEYSLFFYVHMVYKDCFIKKRLDYEKVIDFISRNINF